jgi:hypothetical protein
MSIRYQISIAAFVCIVLVAAAWILVRPTWIITPPSAYAPQPVHFNGYTNGVVGAVATVYGTLDTNHAAVIDRWLTAGTNGLLFTITNQQNCDIIVFPLARICNAGAHPTNDETPILNAPDFSGLRLTKGQVAIIQVADLPHSAPWRLQLYYSRNSCTDSTANRIGQIPEEVRALIFHTPMRAQMHTIESDLIYK